MEVKKLPSHPQLSVEYLLEENNKQLRLRIYVHCKPLAASTKIANIEGERVEGTTTTLYMKSLWDYAEGGRQEKGSGELHFGDR